MFIYKYLKILYRLLAAIFEYKFTEMFLMIHLLQKIPVAPMGVLFPVSKHAQYFARPPIDMQKCFFVHVCKVGLKHLTQPLRCCM